MGLVAVRCARLSLLDATPAILNPVERYSTPTEWLIHAPVVHKGRHYIARKNVHFLCVIGREPFW